MSALVLLLALAGAPNPHLPRALEQIRSLDERGALRTLEKALRWPDNTAEELATVYLYTGLAHAGLANRKEAVAAFRQALVLSSSIALPPDASPLIIKWWREAGGRVVEWVDAGVPDAGEPPLPPAPVEAPDAGTPVAVVEPEPAPPPIVDDRREPSVSPPSWPRWLAVGMMAAGAAGVGTGAYFGVQAQDGSARAQANLEAMDARRLQRDAESSARNANIAYVVGGGVLAAGLVFLLLLLWK